MLRTFSLVGMAAPVGRQPNARILRLVKALRKTASFAQRNQCRSRASVAFRRDEEDDVRAERRRHAARELRRLLVEPMWRAERVRLNAAMRRDTCEKIAHCPRVAAAGRIGKEHGNASLIHRPVTLPRDVRQAKKSPRRMAGLPSQNAECATTNANPAGV